MAVTSLRERKKAKTRRDLKKIAGRLFEKQGYEATTVGQICDEAMIAVNTLFRYFDSKEDLALAPELDRLERFREKITSPERTVDALTLHRDWIVESGWNQTTYRKRQGFTSSVPGLASRMVAISAEYRALLAEGIARDRGNDPARDLHSMLLAAMVRAGGSALGSNWLAQGGTADLESITTEFLDYIIKHYSEPPDSAHPPLIDWENSTIRHGA